MVIDSILCEVGSWLIVRKEFNDILLNPFMSDWVACICSHSIKNRSIGAEWKLPREGNIKLNFDGSSMGNLGSSGFLCTARNDQGKFLFVKCGPLGINCSNAAEIMGLLQGLRMFKARRWYGCQVEGDSKTMSSWASGKGVGSWHWHHYIKEVRALLREF